MATSPRDVGTPGSGIGQDHEQLVDSKGFSLFRDLSKSFCHRDANLDVTVGLRGRSEAELSDDLSSNLSSQRASLEKRRLLGQGVCFITGNFYGHLINLHLLLNKQVVTQAKDTAAAYKLTGINKNRCFSLLVIDDHNTDW